MKERRKCCPDCGSIYWFKKFKVKVARKRYVFCTNEFHQLPSLERNKMEVTWTNPVLFEGVLAEAAALQKRKAQHYGEAWRSQGYMGNVARVLSKASRIKNMLWRDQEITSNDETVEDTLLDIINLAAFTLINYREQNKWGK